MTDTKENLEKFDPSEWEKGQKIDLCSALIRMRNGETVYNTNMSAFYQRHGQEWRVWLNRMSSWNNCYFGASTSEAHDNGGWRTAVRKPKASPAPQPTADEILTDQKPDLEKFDPGEWEFSADVSQRDAIRVMNEGGVVWSSTLQIHFRLRDDGVFCCLYTTKPWEWKPSALPNGSGWCIVTPRPKPQPKPVTAEDILNALKCGKTVVDARGSKVVLRLESPIWERWATFPLTIKPEPKPRRRVTREEAIIAMVKDTEQHAWDEGGLEYRMQKGCHLQMKHTTIVDKVGTWMHTSMSHYSLYLDPPEGT